MAIKKITYNGSSKVIIRLCEVVNSIIDGGGGGGHTIENPSGTSMTQRTGLQFKGPVSVTDDSVNDRTVVTITTKPRDLTVAYTSEIANYSDEWAWIQARLNAHNTDDLRVGDYIPVTVSANTTDNIPAETHQMEISGIDTYYRTGDSGYVVKHHIDWISKDCYSGSHQFNTSLTNNGNSTYPNPFLASAIKSWMDTTLYPLLPSKTKNVIKSKRILAPQRTSGTDDTGRGWYDFDKLWLPLECEVSDTIVWATKGFGGSQSVQYPIFEHSYDHRIKGAGPDGTASAWWNASARSGDSQTIGIIHNTGFIGYANANNATYRIPLCFRTMED